MTGRRFAHAAVHRLREALCSRDPGAVLDAGAIVAALVSRDPSAGVRRAAVVLEAVLLDSGDALVDGVRELLERGVEELLDADDGAPVLDRLFRAIAKALDPTSAIPPPRSLEAEVQEYLARHLCTKTTLAVLARSLGYSASYVSTVIRRVTGRPFTALRQDARLAQARWLLERGESVKHAALEAGFSDPAYFTRVFTRRHGIPPSRWRARPE